MFKIVRYHENNRWFNKSTHQCEFGIDATVEDENGDKLKVHVRDGKDYLIFSNRKDRDKALKKIKLDSTARVTKGLNLPETHKLIS